MELKIAARPLAQKLRRGMKEGKITAPDYATRLEQAVAADVLTADEAAKLRAVDEKVMALIAVDDFAPEELGRKAPAPDDRAPQLLRVHREPPARDEGIAAEA
jgi:hypothetical protein